MIDTVKNCMRFSGNNATMPQQKQNEHYLILCMRIQWQWYPKHTKILKEWELQTNFICEQRCRNIQQNAQKSHLRKIKIINEK